MDWYGMSDPAIMAEIGKRLKEYRIRKSYTQSELAVKMGISILSVQNLEKGCSVSLSIFISALRMLYLLGNLETLIPDPPVSPVELLKLKGKARIRVKKSGLKQKK